MNLTEDKKGPLRKKAMTERRAMLSMWMQKDVSQNKFGLWQSIVLFVFQKVMVISGSNSRH
jgi:hypothetical protein